MERKDIVLLVLLAAALVLSVGYSFYKTVILQDFQAVNITEEVATSTDQSP